MKTYRTVPRQLQILAVSGLLLASLACSILSVDQFPAAPPATATLAGRAVTSTPATLTGQAVTPTPATLPTLGAAPSTATPAAPPIPVNMAANDFSSVVREVAQLVKPAVVQITNQQTQVDAFNQPFSVPAGVGSGVIYDQEGHILTNNHVVEGAETLLVSLPDERSFEARLIGADPQTDLAVVQITGDNLPVAQLGDSNQLQVGDWVVAIGNALGLPGGPTVTVGVVSALGRTVQEPGSDGGLGPFLFDVVQTSTPINPGNSGGPLVNLAGQVIGINTLVAGQAEPGVQAQGIGFAIAISTAKPIADQLVANGRVVHPYLGITYVPLNPAISAQLGIQAKDGIVIAEVVPGSPAAEAGLKSEDVITAFEGNPIKGESGLAQFISTRRPGDTVALTVVRGNRTAEVPVTLAEMPSGG